MTAVHTAVLAGLLESFFDNLPNAMVVYGILFGFGIVLNLPATLILIGTYRFLIRRKPVERPFWVSMSCSAIATMAIIALFALTAREQDGLIVLALVPFLLITSPMSGIIVGIPYKNFHQQGTY